MANTVTTYVKEGDINVHELLRSLVIDLTGVNTQPENGPAKAYFNLVYPTTIDLSQPLPDTDSYLVILESTLNVDPYHDTDPWRIGFHVHKWKNRPLGEAPTSGSGIVDKPDIKEVYSMSVYLGTASTLALDSNGDPVLAFTQTPFKKAPYYTGGLENYWEYRFFGNDANKNKWTKDANGRYIVGNYKVYDLVEPPGNTGAVWTNTFDVTPVGDKVITKVSGDQKIDPYESPAEWDGPDISDPDQTFVNRWVLAGQKVNYGGVTGLNLNNEYAYPLSYRIVCSDHGVFIGVWGPDPEENGANYSWLVAQRPVDKKTGVVRGLTNPINTERPGNRPLFCVNSVNNKFWKFVVREHDLAVPSARKDATQNTEDSGAVINPYQQQSLTENGEYVITFLNNINSSRFKYADELDMVGTVSADVVGGGADIDVNVYGEYSTDQFGQKVLEPRRYHAMWSQGPYGTKMRIMVVSEIPSGNPPPAL